MGVEDAGDLLGSQDGDGERLPLGWGNVFVEPATLVNADVEEAERGADHLEVRWALFAIAQVEEKLTNLFRTEQFGRLAIVLNESPDDLLPIHQYLRDGPAADRIRECGVSLTVSPRNRHPRRRLP